MGLASHFAVDYAPIARHDARHLRTGADPRVGTWACVAQGLEGIRGTTHKG
jgi:hypothetical protein